eukprot:6195626-Pleurochrysis_carterae.AAC.1
MPILRYEQAEKRRKCRPRLSMADREPPTMATPVSRQSGAWMCDTCWILNPPAQAQCHANVGIA